MHDCLEIAGLEDCAQIPIARVLNVIAMTKAAEHGFAFPHGLEPVLRLAQSRRVRACVCAVAAAAAVSTAAVPALAEGNVNMRGAAVFSANCAGCHAGG